MLALSRSASWINRLYTDYTGPMDEHMTQMNKDSWHSSRMKRKQKQKYIKCLFESTLTTVAKQACKFGCTSWGTQSHLIKDCVFSRVIFLDMQSNNLWQYLHFKVIISKWTMTPQGALFYWVKLFLYHQKSPTQELIHYNFSVEWAIQKVYVGTLHIIIIYWWHIWSTFGSYNIFQMEVIRGGLSERWSTNCSLLRWPSNILNIPQILSKLALETCFKKFTSW